MREGSFDVPPIDDKAIHQGVDELSGVMACVSAQVGVFDGGENGAVAEDFLNLEQIYPGLDQMGGIAVAQIVRGDLFFSPHWTTTLRRVVCTPPRSRGVLARHAAFRPPWRLGNSSTGLR